MTTRLVDVKYYMLLPTVDHIGTPFDNIQWIIREDLAMNDPVKDEVGTEVLYEDDRFKVWDMQLAPGEGQGR